MNESGESFDGLLARAEAELSSGDTAVALATVRNAVRAKPNDRRALNLFAVIQCEFGRIEAAQDIFEGLVRSYTDALAPRFQAGVCAILLGQWSRAEEHFRAVMERFPDERSAYAYLSLVHWQLGQHDLARAALETIGKADLLSSGRGDAAQIENLLRDVAIAERPSVKNLPTEWRDLKLVRVEGLLKSTDPIVTTPVDEEVDVVLGNRVKPLVAHRIGPLMELDTDVMVFRFGSYVLNRESAHGVCVMPARIWLREGRLKQSPATFYAKGAQVLAEQAGLETSWVCVEGDGLAVLLTPQMQELSLIKLRDETIYVDAQCVEAFSASLHRSIGKVPRYDRKLFQLTGSGYVLVHTPASVYQHFISQDQSVSLRAQHLVGWTGEIAVNLNLGIDPREIILHGNGRVILGG